jgi:SAM-dependent methyltransferase
MGMGMASFDYLAAKRLISVDSRILDIGSQNLYNATPQTIRKFAELFGSVSVTPTFDAEVDRISYFSTPRAGERTAYISELLNLTTIGYESYDVCPALKTDIFDLNVERLPDERRNNFDLILNFGTTEHLINQLNAFEVMHDAMKVGGVAFHQLPSVGWIGVQDDIDAL